MANTKVSFCTNQDSLPVPKGYKQISLSELKDNLENFEVLIGVGEIEVRARIIEELAGLNLHFPTIIHPRAYVQKSATIGLGTIVFSNCYIGPKAQIGNFAIINTNSIIEHNSYISNSTVIAPSVTLAGNVIVGKNSFVGMGTCVSEQVQIVDNCIIGANSFVNSNVPSHTKVFGNPAKVSVK